MANYRYVRLFLIFLFGVTFLLNDVQSTPLESLDVSALDRPVQTRSATVPPTTKRGDSFLFPRKKPCRKSKHGTCKPKRSVSHVIKRTSTLAEIYKNIPQKNKVTTGNTRHVLIDNTKAVAYAATECIGCSVVIIINGKELLMGHYAEETGTPPTVTIESKVATQKAIIDSMNPSLDMFEESDDTHAFLFHSSKNPTPAGLALWKEHMDESACIPVQQIQGKQYLPIRVVEGGLEELPNGKIVVTITPQPGGEAIITIYSNSDTPKWSQRYDRHGNPC